LASQQAEDHQAPDSDKHDGRLATPTGNANVKYCRQAGVIFSPWRFQIELGRSCPWGSAQLLELACFLPRDCISLLCMETQRKVRQKINSIPAGRWTAYAAAGAATAFAGIHSANAAIHYSGRIDENFNSSQVDILPLDPAGPAFLSFRHNVHFYSTSVKDGGSAFFGVGYGAPLGFSVSCAFNNSLGSVSRLDRGDVISAGPFSSRAIIIGTREGFGCGGGGRGQFGEGGVAFIGFEFNNGNGEQYGWARIKVLLGGRNQFKLVDYAYGDIGDKVKAGELTTGQSPTLQSLGGLALGAAGLLAWRRRRSLRGNTSTLFL
jgi:hypothetical protein